jgi:hypothetical protein
VREKWEERRRDEARPLLEPSAPSKMTREREREREEGKEQREAKGRERSELRTLTRPTVHIRPPNLGLGMSAAIGEFWNMDPA